MSPPSPSPVSPFLQFLLPFSFFFFLLPTLKLSADAEEQLCNSSTGGCKRNNMTISHPFWRIGGSDDEEEEDPICRPRNFGVNCSNADPDYPLLTINGHDYLVRSISYRERSITLVDSQLIPLQKDDCSPWGELQQSLDLNVTAPFSYDSGVDLEITFFSNCARPPPDEIPHFYGIGCDSYLFVGPIDPLSLSRIGNCTGKIETAVRRTEEMESGKWEWNVSFRAAMEQGFVLDWNYPSSQTRHKGGGRRTTKLFIGLVAGAVGALLISAVFFYCKIKPLRRKTEHFKTAAINRDIEAFIKGHGPLALTRYRFAEIKKMTNSFEVKLGQGGYGKVYKGKLPDGHLVAVKLLTLSKGNGEDFINEVASISRTSHVNIVNLLGFCLEGHKRILVYEFMPSGSLDKFINNNVSHNSLSWENLYQIALGTARGLEYLHKGCNTRILHFDIKPHNILLDENFCPKISDFGLAKLCLNKESIISISQARGTVGYLAPEIWNRNFGGISHKSDVYSYGMMLIDMVGGRNNTNVETKSASENYFPDWIYNKLEQDCSLESNGTNNIDENDVAMRMTIVGLWCIQTFPSHRPTIGRVIEMLEGNLSALEIPPKPILSSPPRLQCEFSSTTKTTSTTAFISDPNSGKHQSEARTSIAC